MRHRLALLAPLVLLGCPAEHGWRPERAPLEVTLSGDATDLELAAVDAAARRWRAEVGDVVVRLAVSADQKPRCGQVDLSFAPMTGMVNGTTIRRACRASIVLSRDLSPEYLSVVAAHELGHALGLDHEADPSSLMYASAPRDGGHISRAALDYVESLLEP